MDIPHYKLDWQKEMFEMIEVQLVELVECLSCVGGLELSSLYQILSIFI